MFLFKTLNMVFCFVLLVSEVIDIFSSALSQNLSCKTVFQSELKMVYNISSCQKYDYYIQHGIDLKHVSPLDDSWLENILEKVPCHLRSQSPSQKELVKEIKEDYLFNVKKAIGIYSTHAKIFGSFAIHKNVARYQWLKYIFLFVIAVNYTFRDTRESCEDKVEDLPPQRLE